MRRFMTAGVAVALAGVLATVVLAGTVNGTAKNDVLRGSAKADKIDGRAGNDKLYGLAGNDVLIGGAGNDLLVGGPGSDNLNCGAGTDLARADDSDKVSPTCEKVTGITPPAVSIADASVAEGNSGPTALAFQVSLSKASKQAASVSFATADGTASAPGDYASAGGKLTFAPGETSKTINVSVVGDTAFEPDESFTVTLSSPTGATTADGSATGTIANDDPPYRTGSYAGTTAQGKPITFDVSSDAKQVVNVKFGFDINCTEVRGFTLTDTLRILVPLPIGPDGTFSLSDTDADSEGKVTFEFNGKLTAPSSASGTFKLAIELYGIPGIGTLHCQSGATPLTWNAS